MGEEGDLLPFESRVGDQPGDQVFLTIKFHMDPFFGIV
jgi:hypothetical protein